MQDIFEAVFKAPAQIGEKVVDVVFDTGKFVGQVSGAVAQTVIGTGIETTQKAAEILAETGKATFQVGQKVTETLVEEVVHHEPYLIPIEPSRGWDEALVFINGFLSEGETQPWKKKTVVGNAPTCRMAGIPVLPLVGRFQS